MRIATSSTADYKGVKAPIARPSLQRRKTSAPVRLLSAAIGWSWRLAVGILFCLNYLTSIVVVGWSYRWIQGIVLRSWWKQSSKRGEGTFDEFRSALGLDAPTSRPRWLLQENIRRNLHQPTADGRTPMALRLCVRSVMVPWHSLWLNFKIGLQALLGTYVLTGLGCLVMLGSWEFGWLNSFNKGYEQALIGPLTGFLGVFLFVAAMVYVPMAQVHQAVTGDLRAFFDFRFVWRLIQARPFAYAAQAAFVLFASVVLEILKTAPAFFDGFIPSWRDASATELLGYLYRYLVVCCAVLFPTLLAARYFASRVYRKAVLRVIEDKLVARSDLHPTLVGWMKTLDLGAELPAQAPSPGFWAAGSIAWWLVGVVDFVALLAAGLVLFAAGPVGFLAVLGIWLLHCALLAFFCLFRRGRFRSYLAFTRRRVAYGLLLWIWFLFVAKTYGGEFFNYHPFVGFANHTLVQLPCFNFVPTQLQQAAQLETATK